MPDEAFSQRDRLFRLNTPLGPDKFALRKFGGTEAVSELFHFTLDLASEDVDIQSDDVLGKNFTVAMLQSDGSSERFFNGYISRFRQVPEQSRFARYHAEMVPWLWFLTLSHGCHIYQEMKVEDVIKKVFQQFGYHDYEFRLRGRHERWEYCCQYRETAFAFVSRLMEIEGMYYYFHPEEGKHTLIIADSKTTHEPNPYQSTFRFDKVTGPGYLHEDDSIPEWKPEARLRPSRYAHRDYNFITPKDKLAGLGTSDEDEADSEDPRHEIYDYPGEYELKEDAEDWARLRIEEQEMDHAFAEGSGRGRAMIPGYKFQLINHDRKDQNTNYLITRVTHEAEDGTLLGGTDAQSAKYENRFKCIFATDQYRPERKTKKAQMLGAQTAFVVGPKGEEIHTDPYGRVKVKFHWDRKKKSDDTSSCWIRVMQPWTGMQFGQIWIPRVGQEVIVDFLEGDPDRPIITGCIYNADNLPPYKLPDNKTVSGIKTRSTKNGKQDNFNEIYLEDKKGSELFRIQAEKDMTTLVKHDEQVTVGNDRTELVQNDEHITIKGEKRESVGKNLSVDVVSDVHFRAGQNIYLEAGADIHLRAGGRIVVEAPQGIVFLENGGFISIAPGVVQIQGEQVLINCGLPLPDGALPANPLVPNLPAGVGEVLSGHPQSSVDVQGSTQTLAQTGMAGAGVGEFLQSLGGPGLTDALTGSGLGSLSDQMAGLQQLTLMDPASLQSALSALSPDQASQVSQLVQGGLQDPSSIQTALSAMDPQQAAQLSQILQTVLPNLSSGGSASDTGGESQAEIQDDEINQ